MDDTKWSSGCQDSSTWWPPLGSLTSSPPRLESKEVHVLLGAVKMVVGMAGGHFLQRDLQREERQVPGRTAQPLRLT